MGARKRAGRPTEDRTFWTICPYCFYLHEYDKAYEECCLRCQNCRKGFHAVAVHSPPPPPASLVERGGEEEERVGAYQCRLGCFSMRYIWAAKEGRGFDDDKNRGAGEGRKKNVKSVARNTKKIMGRGLRNSGVTGVEMGGEVEKNGEESKSGMRVDRKSENGFFLDLEEGDDVFVSI